MSVHQLARKTTLTVNKSTLTFPTTPVGTPKFAVLTITQPGDEPVTLSSDSPDYFQLASDNQPKFSPTLTLKAAPMGTYVHVRYQTDKSGSHSGQLTVQGAHDEKTVALEGRTTARFLPVRSIRPAYGLPVRTKPSGSRKKILLILGSIALFGLAWLGYANRATLFSGEASDEVETQSMTQPQPLPSAVLTDKNGSAKRSAPTATRRQAKHEPTQLASEKQTNTPPAQNLSESSLPQTASSQVAQVVDRQSEPMAKSVNEVGRQQPNRRVKSTEEESELEKELNQSPPK